MTAQSSLPLSDPRDLSSTPRLAWALDYIRNAGPVTALEVGQAYRSHRRRPGVSRDEYNRSEGNSIVKALQKRKLIRYRNVDGQRRYYAVVPGTGRAWREAVGEEFEWPEGF